MTPPSTPTSTSWSIKLPIDLRVVEVLKTEEAKEKEKEKMEPTTKREEQVKKDTGLHNKIN
jgi:hypothetical protein